MVNSKLITNFLFNHEIYIFLLVKFIIIVKEVDNHGDNCEVVEKMKLV